MITPLDALRVVLDNIEPIGEELVGVFGATGRVVSRPIKSLRTLPPYDDAAMDGYAVRFEDIKEIPAQLKLKGTIKAGDSVKSLEVKEGECYRVMTGAALPKGADTIVEFEITEQEDGFVRVIKPKSKGSNVRFKGEDINYGDAIDFTGEVVTPYRLSRIVSTGNVFVPVYKKPSVCVISTGDELIHLGDPKEGIVDSNSFFVKSLLGQFGIDVSYLGISKDRSDDFIQKMHSACEFDIIITTAGISFGDYDVVTNSEKELNIEWFFKYVKQKPGKPFAFGRLKNSLVFSFPGNPVSTAFCSFFYLIPAIKKMLGYKKYQHQYFKATLTKPLNKRNNRVHFNRVKVELKDGRFYATPFEAQGSNIIESIAQCNGFTMIEQDRLGRIDAGEEVVVFLYDYEFLF
ncbi:molybdopterin molybdotransferase MoeA [Hippea sp. KM1]|uniref:molybdopterin molybdotransferase MoeA n=1 Tax=Hippea sp. KM1 TaxID=944481 RepID=UPI00046D3294|nr:molybdopterin molybdotransferase MoeA [Hippea sp. KM1]